MKAAGNKKVTSLWTLRVSCTGREVIWVCLLDRGRPFDVISEQCMKNRVLVHSVLDEIVDVDDALARWLRNGLEKHPMSTYLYYAT